MRERCPRKAHENWKAEKAREDPVAQLIANSVGRLPRLLPIRYGRMMASPFTFYRGAAAIMAADLAHTPVSGLRVQACGDCHLLNFGGFATPERQLVFDINDFDETAVAPWEWDVKRLAASFAIAARTRGFRRLDVCETAATAARSYQEHMAGLVRTTVLDAWCQPILIDELGGQPVDKGMKRVYETRMTENREREAHAKEYERLAHDGRDGPRIRDDPPLIYHSRELTHGDHMTVFESSMAEYLRTLPTERRILMERFKIVDAAVKVVGIGSVGTFCGVVLLMSGNGDPLFLQLKEARASVLEPFTGASPYRHHGQRVVIGQHLMQAASDMFLGWTTHRGSGGTSEKVRHFYIRRLHDAKVKPMVDEMKPSNLRRYAALCGKVLARAHARSGDAVVIAAYLGKNDDFAKAVARFSETYAEQNERDYEAFLAAIRDGRLEARSE